MINIKLIKGDITKLEVDAIVNAANTSLLGGGGVDGAIHRVGGKEILEECYKIRNKQGGCKVGDAVITNAGKLPCSYVIHTVGPKWNNGKSRENELLSSCYFKSLEIAVEKNIKSIAFPNISTGIYGFPKDKAAVIAIETIKSFQCVNEFNVYITCFDNENYALYEELLKIKREE
jgi:O-acetyl-ADP-ribose deacetylase (regulator of RNase III)